MKLRDAKPPQGKAETWVLCRTEPTFIVPRPHPKKGERVWRLVSVFLVWPVLDARAPTNIPVVRCHMTMLKLRSDWFT